MTFQFMTPHNKQKVRDNEDKDHTEDERDVTDT